MPRAVHHGPRLQYRSNQTEYRIDRIEIRKIFQTAENREDGSDFDDFWTESIVLTQSIFSKIFERAKNYRIDRIDRFNRSIDRSYRSMAALVLRNLLQKPIIEKSQIQIHL